MRARLLMPALVAMLVLSIAGGRLYAAFQERDILNTINNTVAVLRYLSGQVKELREKSEMVKNTRLLTEQQYATQKGVVQEEQERRKPSQIKLDVFKISLAKLERQTAILREKNLEKTYVERLKKVNESVNAYRIQLDAKLLEFQVHFGKSPNVNLDFEAKISRFRQKELGVTYLTIK